MVRMKSRMIFAGTVAVAMLACAVLLGAMPAYAHVPTKVVANGIDMVANPGSPGDAMHYDGNGTLVLTDAFIDTATTFDVEGDDTDCAVYADGDLHIVLAGTSRLSFHASQEDPGNAINAVRTEGSVSFTGGGVLRTDEGCRVGLGVGSGGDLFVEGATLDLDCVTTGLLSGYEQGDIALADAVLRIDCNYSASEDMPYGALGILVPHGEGVIEVERCSLEIAALGRQGGAVRVNGGGAIASSDVSLQGNIVSAYAEGPLRFESVAGSMSGAAQGAIMAPSISFSGSCQLRASNLLEEGEGDDTSAAISSKGDISFDLAEGGYVIAQAPANGTNSMIPLDRIPAVLAEGFPEQASLAFAPGTGIVDPAGARIETYEDSPFVGYYIVAADGSFVRTVTIARRSDPAPADYAVPLVRKVLAGKTPSHLPTFSFVLEAASAGAPMPASARVAVAGAGTASFGSLAFERAGSYRYTISEVGDGGAGWSYSDAVYDLDVTVDQAEDGSLRAAGVLSLQGAACDTAEFCNDYQGPGPMAPTGDTGMPLVATLLVLAAAGVVVFAGRARRSR